MSESTMARATCRQCGGIVDWIGNPHVLNGRLPDYEALREVVAAMWNSVENNTEPANLEQDMEWEHRWAQVSDLLDRLSEVPA